MNNQTEKVIKINDVLHFLEVSLPAHTSMEVWRKLGENKWSEAIVILEREKSKSKHNIETIQSLEDSITFFKGMGK
jgi:hypothetical protein